MDSAIKKQRVIIMRSHTKNCIQNQERNDGRLSRYSFIDT